MAYSKSLVWKLQDRIDFLREALVCANRVRQIVLSHQNDQLSYSLQVIGQRRFEDFEGLPDIGPQVICIQPLAAHC